MFFFLDGTKLKIPTDITTPLFLFTDFLKYDLLFFIFRLAELDLDPETTKIDKIKLAICSLHFHDGYPTDQYPLPTELLSNKTPEQKNEFKGTKNNENCDSGINDQDIIETDEELETVKFSQIGKISNKMFYFGLFALLLPTHLQYFVKFRPFSHCCQPI